MAGSEAAGAWRSTGAGSSAHGQLVGCSRPWVGMIARVGLTCALRRRLLPLVQAMSTGASAAQPPAIEVERKFLLPVDADSLEALRRRIVAKGGALIKRISFEDSYFDSPSYSLTLGDHWLRQRDGAWELKVPGRHVGGTAVYTELETELEIASALAKQLEIPAPPASLDELLTVLHCAVRYVRHHSRVVFAPSRWRVPYRSGQCVSQPQQPANRPQLPFAGRACTLTHASRRRVLLARICHRSGTVSERSR